MEATLNNLFTDMSYLVLTLLISVTLFFIMAGFREQKENPFQGLFYLCLGLFFAVAHMVFLLILPTSFLNSFETSTAGIWNWVVILFAPALILLYLAFGLFYLLTFCTRSGLVRLFFGLTLICYLYMLGPDWAVDVRGILALVWGLTWFQVELRMAN